MGLATANAVVISFSDPRIALAILRSLRRLRGDVPVLVRTPDDTRARELKEAGATEVVPEAFEASLMLASHVLMSLKVPAARVMRSVEELRSQPLRDAAQCHRARRRLDERCGVRRTGAFGGGAAGFLVHRQGGRGGAQRRCGSRIHRHPPPGHPRAAILPATPSSRKVTSW